MFFVEALSRMDLVLLKRTQDRKTANMSTPNGKQSKIANAFSLPAGNAYSCPGATSFCQSICYAGKLERIYKGFRDVVLHNWNLLKDAHIGEMASMIDEMIVNFIMDCEKHDAPKLFRIHADGDFFNMTYVRAWSRVISIHPDVQFWAYTRSDFAAEYLHNRHANLGLYFSGDSVNVETANRMAEKGIKIAFVDTTFAKARESFKGVRCPEQNNKDFGIIDNNGGACVRCGLCPMARGNVLFSSSKK